jgi:arylformamidase
VHAGETNNVWIDVSVSLHSGMVHWPDNPPVRIERALNIEHGDAANVSEISMGAHTGTHMDGPIHFVPFGKGLDEMPLTATIGRARVIEISDPEAVKPDELRSYRLQRGEGVQFKTQNSARSWSSEEEFIEDFVYVSREAARYLADRGIRTVGVDYLSVGGFRKDGAETHQTLLEAEIWVIEGLDLSEVEPGEYEPVCLPIKIEQSDGAPARAVLRAI